jgi:hypothetical protein
MARVDIPIWTPPGERIDPVDNTIALTALNPTDEAQFLAGEGILLFLKCNNSGTATIITMPDPEYGRDDSLVVTATAGEFWIAGPFPRKGFAQTDGYIYIDITGTNPPFHAAAIDVGRAGVGPAPPSATAGTRTLLTPVAAPGYALPNTGAEVTMAACTGGSSDGCDFPMTGRDLLLVQRTAGGAQNFIVSGSANRKFGREDAMYQGDWAAGATNLHVFGPIGTDGYQQSNGKAIATSQTDDFTAALVTLPR